ncbi:MAG: SDR family NAD(P)-dependent oxidoreductase [Proteobacteria bacterium]|nr:SDR family NAD(P)-dependent oxidoreductase [Pseudomonadota bacterium]
MNNVLVTGANGCIGNVLVRILVNSSYEVTALALDKSDTDKIKNIENLKIVFGDICDRKSMEEIFAAANFNIVVHLAGIVHNPEATLEECMEVNCRATCDLFDLSQSYGTEQFIFVSSVAVYGEEVESVLDEGSLVDPRTPYAVSKLKAEEYIKNSHDCTTKYTIIQPTTVYGKYDRGNINKLVSVAKRGFVPIFGNGNNLKSFVYVDNLAEGILKVICNEMSYNQTFILSDSEPYSMNQTIKAIEGAMGKRVVSIRFPIGAVILALKLFNRITRIFGKKVFLSISSLKKLVTNTIFDISKARRILNYEPRYTLSDGLLKAYGAHSDENGIK